ncbi:MAG: large-conductance mechanosensitive channel protein MscL [Planctomycetota bacterium]|jgi:large conductance mechanosensitive channel
MGIFKEFREFAVRGNVMDLAVGVVIGASFQKIVDSLVKNLIMPVVGFLTGNVNVAELQYTPPIPEGVTKAKPPTLGYGAFLQSIVDFVIIAAAIFFLIKAINMAKSRFEKAKEDAPPPPPSEDVLLLREIRDALAKNSKGA